MNSPTAHDSAPAPQDRRRFFRAIITGAGAAALGPQLLRGAAPATRPAAIPGRFREPERDLPLQEDADVIVCGGGPAGVAAAITAARAGARTRLIEGHGCLGGVWTAGLLTYIFDFDKPGMTRELLGRLEKRDARRGNNVSRFVYEPDEMKVLLEEMCTEAGVKFHLHTRVTAAHREGRRLGRTSRAECQRGL